MTITLPTPTPKQTEFINDRHKYLAYGGSRGGGKSWGVRLRAIIYACKYPKSRQMIVRRTYPELIENHIKPMREMLNGYAKYNDQRKEMKFPNGSEILFRYCATENDILNFQGIELDTIYIDEATQFDEEVFLKLSACLRGVNAYPKAVICTTNPGGKGHQWVKRLFIDRKFKDRENPDDYRFIQSSVMDNKPLLRANPDYVAQLEMLPNALRLAWLEGRWDVFEGAFFEEFRDDPQHYDDRHWTHVINPFPIPSHWTIYRSYDHGYSKPFSCGYYAVDTDGCAYMIYDFYGWTGEANVGVKWNTETIFTKMKQLEDELPLLKGRHIIGVADPAIWQTQTGESIADTASRCGIFFSPGDNKRIAGWMQVHNRLRFDKNGLPMLYFFKNCENMIRTLPLMQYSETVCEDMDTTLEDHESDQLRYFAMCRPMKATEPIEDDGFNFNPLHTIFKLNREDLK